MLGLLQFLDGGMWTTQDTDLARIRTAEKRFISGPFVVMRAGGESATPAQSGSGPTLRAWRAHTVAHRATTGECVSSAVSRLEGRL